eukprot:CAMPEP_0119378098 /NCGR_PEP_ID=MMETSP1334-20130426/47399_1 /TAXON_ID=127549 /ORGANISM="Calcidiscus leptoporus, Strain RCC1130" /LENGTH=884 /DNA_ID=CAMNT_0007397207 /DNA_START=89 /DNA_END=2744 /DNA_ORIENTATION=-
MPDGAEQLMPPAMIHDVDFAVEAEGRVKGSRWQIGSSALTVLEQVYTMEPFPGLETRRELSRKLNVSVRQVQVWFQNKRQRERKISRAKGLYSTPGLPDTPQASLAKAAAAAGMMPDEFCSLANAPERQAKTAAESAGASSEEMSSCATPAVAQAANTSHRGSQPGASGAQATTASESASVSVLSPPSQPGLREGEMSPLLPVPRGYAEEEKPFFSRVPLPGLPMTRTVSLDQQSGSSALHLPLPTSFDDSEIPLGLDQPCGAGSDHMLPRKPSVTHRVAAGTAPSRPPMLPPQMPLARPNVPAGAGGASPAGMASLMRYCSSFGGPRPDLNLPWLSSHLPATSEQVEMHCRAAVAAAAAALGNQAAAGGSGVNPWLMRQNMFKQLGLPPTGHQQAQASRLLNSYPMNGVDNLAVEDLPVELQEELLDESEQTLPWVQETPSTHSALMGGAASACRGAGIDGNAPRRGPGTHPALKSRRTTMASSSKNSSAQLRGLPMKHSGVSGIMDEMSLFSADAATSEYNSDASSMDTLPASTSGLELAAATQSASCVDMACAHKACPSSSAEEEQQQAAADQHVQVITSKEEPFQIVWASQAWLDLCEYKPEQVVGRTLELIQGPLTSRPSVDALMDAIRKGESMSVDMINHTSSGKAFSHVLRVEPLCDSKGDRQCFQATSSKIQFLQGPEPSHGSPGSPVQKNFKRTSSEIAINEMLDLLNETGDTNSVVTSPRSPLSSPAMVPRALTDESSVVDAFLSMAEPCAQKLGHRVGVVASAGQVAMPWIVYTEVVHRLPGRDVHDSRIAEERVQAPEIPRGCLSPRLHLKDEDDSSSRLLSGQADEKGAQPLRAAAFCHIERQPVCCWQIPVAATVSLSASLFSHLLQKLV